MTKQWEECDDGKVWVDGEYPTLGPSIQDFPAGGQRRMITDTLSWYDTILAEKDDRISVSNTLATIYSESGGKIRALSSAGAVGLMQIMPQFSTMYTRAQLYTPEISIRRGTEILGKHKDRGWKLPERASLYNAGAEPVSPGSYKPHPSTKHGWGMRSDPPKHTLSNSYIDHIVNANNWFTDFLAAGNDPRDFATDPGSPSSPGGAFTPAPPIASKAQSGQRFAGMVGAAGFLGLLMANLPEKKAKKLPVTTHHAGQFLMAYAAGTWLNSMGQRKA